MAPRLFNYTNGRCEAVVCETSIRCQQIRALIVSSVWSLVREKSDGNSKAGIRRLKQEG